MTRTSDTPTPRTPATAPGVHVVSEAGATAEPRPSSTTRPDATNPGAIHTAIDRAGSDNYASWLGHVLPAGACTHPVRLHGTVGTRIDTTTGAVIDSGRHTEDMPDGVVYKPCGNRRTSVCPSCAELYRADAYQLVLAGLKGGKGVPDAVAGHTAVFSTLTGPSFGLVHTHRTRKDGTPAPCRARREPEPCPHGVDLRCTDRHADDAEALGRPLCPACYDYDHHVVWNLFSAELWRRTTIAAKRRLDQLAKAQGDEGRVRLSFGKVAEMQRRGLIHYHALVRIDGRDPDNPDAHLPPPAWANAFVLTAILRHAIETARYTTPPHPTRPDGWEIVWGAQTDIRPVRTRTNEPITDNTVTNQLDGNNRRRILSGNAVAGYLAKYATKATETAGHSSRRLTTETADIYMTNTHIGRIIQACWHIGSPYIEHDDNHNPIPIEYRRLRRWAHMLGYGGHFFTKSRRWSTTFKALRQARADWREAQHHTQNHTDDDETQLHSTNNLVYAGTGWLTIGDALLANTAATKAREHRRTVQDELETA